MVFDFMGPRVGMPTDVERTLNEPRTVVANPVELGRHYPPEMTATPEQAPLL